MQPESLFIRELYAGEDDYDDREGITMYPGDDGKFDGKLWIANFWHSDLM